MRAVAARAGCSPTSLYDRELVPAVKEAAAEQRARLVDRRRGVDQRIVALTEQLAAALRQIDGWIERWAAVEHWALTYDYDADKIFAPLPGPGRATLRVLRRPRSTQGR
ncbi:MAG TPA: hypothetical protein VFC93_00535 [Chloroflexota bacterium]|nr:hypothetical protein [Chloroflexota bacterium]